MESMGMEVERYKSDLHDKPILRMKKTENNKKIADKINAMNITRR